MADSKRTMKTCSKCGETKEASTAFFTRRSDSADGLHRQCKACRYASNREYARSHREERRAYERGRIAERRAKNRVYEAQPERREKRRVYAKAYMAANREEIRAYKSSPRYRDLEAKRQSSEREQIRIRARSAVKIAVKSGRLVPRPCEICGTPPIKVNGKRRVHAHHHKGYDKKNWLDVQWLCITCHGVASRK